MMRISHDMMRTLCTTALRAVRAVRCARAGTMAPPREGAP